jgi:hypothetical protein
MYSAGHQRYSDITSSGDATTRSDRASSDPSRPPDLERGHSFYSRASQKRQLLATSRSRAGSIDSPGASPMRAAHSAGSLTSLGAGTPRITAEPLRRILEDYLEVDSSLNLRLQQLLHATVLIRYFRRQMSPELEILYDTDQIADKVGVWVVLMCDGSYCCIRDSSECFRTSRV